MGKRPQLMDDEMLASTRAGRTKPQPVMHQWAQTVSARHRERRPESDELKNPMSFPALVRTVARDRARGEMDPISSTFWFKRKSHFRLLIFTIFSADSINFTMPTI